jgi:hypothetical protein
MANGKTMSLWECVCDCESVVTVRLHNLRSENTQSCGCLYREAAEQRRGLKFHNKAEYNTWSGMKGRCNTKTNGSYINYGGRGISVCKRWEDSFEDFLSDVGKKPHPEMQLDRMNNDGNYEPGNVRWATPTEQSRNRRTTIRITIDGQTKCLAEWAGQFGIAASIVEMRIRRLGWGAEKALSTPKLASRHDPRSPSRSSHVTEIPVKTCALGAP